MIWLVGNKGMLGSEIAACMAREKFDFTGSDRNVDITSAAAIWSFAQGKSIQWIVNCAAYTAVDKAESEPDRAGQLNIEGPRNLGELAGKTGAGIVHISTDYVFSGNGRQPYREDDPVEPTGVYGRTKAQGEAELRNVCDRWIILRTAWLYGKNGSNFVYTMLRLMREREELGVVTDQRGSPTWTADLAHAIVDIVREPPVRAGVYHFAGLGETSWFDFALEIHRLGRKKGILDRDCTIRPLTTDQYPTAARRPAYSVLSTDKVSRDFGIVARSWKESLADFFDDAFADANGFERISTPVFKKP